MAIHTLRPSGDYSAPFNATTIVGAATGWQAVNESSPDEDTSYVTTTGIYFATVLPNTMPTATINSVKVVVRARHDGTASTINFALYDNTFSFAYTTELGPTTVTGSYVDYSVTDTLRADTGTAFTKTVLDDAVFVMLLNNNSIRVTQVYVEIDYVGGGSTNAILFAGN